MDADRQAEAAVLDLLVREGALWSGREVAAALGDELDAADALLRLRQAGLAHRLDGEFWVATRAAARAAELRL